jgi:hypothetical protein
MGMEICCSCIHLAPPVVEKKPPGDNRAEWKRSQCSYAACMLRVTREKRRLETVCDILSAVEETSADQRRVAIMIKQGVARIEPISVYLFLLRCR